MWVVFVLINIKMFAVIDKERRPAGRMLFGFDIKDTPCTWLNIPHSIPRDHMDKTPSPLRHPCRFGKSERLACDEPFSLILPAPFPRYPSLTGDALRNQSSPFAASPNISDDWAEIVRGGIRKPSTQFGYCRPRHVTCWYFDSCSFRSTHDCRLVDESAAHRIGMSCRSHSREKQPKRVVPWEFACTGLPLNASPCYTGKMYGILWMFETKQLRHIRSWVCRWRAGPGFHFRERLWSSGCCKTLLKHLQSLS